MKVTSFIKAKRRGLFEDVSIEIRERREAREEGLKKVASTLLNKVSHLIYKTISRRKQVVILFNHVAVGPGLKIEMNLHNCTFNTIHIIVLLFRDPARTALRSGTRLVTPGCSLKIVIGLAGSHWLS